MTMYRKHGEPFKAQQFNPGQTPYPDGVTYEAGAKVGELCDASGRRLGPVYPGDWVAERDGSRIIIAPNAFAVNYEPVPDLATVNFDPKFVLEVTNTEGNQNELFKHRPINFHVRGLRGNDGEDESVMAVMVETDQSPHYPECGRIIVGSPEASPLLDGHLPNLGGFCGSPYAIEQFARVLLHGVALARKAIAKDK